MATVLNVLAGVLVLLYFALQRMFRELIEREQAGRPSAWLGAAIVLACTSVALFTALGLYSLATAGFLPVAAALAFFCGVAVLRIRDDARKAAQRLAGDDPAQ